MLVENNEWLRGAEDYYDVDVENKSEGPSSNVGKSVKSRKKIEVESKPERNMLSPYRKEQPQGKKQMIAILSDSLIKNLKHRNFQQKNFLITDSMSNHIRVPPLPI